MCGGCGEVWESVSIPCELEGVKLANEFRRNPFSRNSNGQRTTQRHGAIFLADDEEVAFIIPKPFCLQPAPSRSKTVKQNKGCESETESEKFTYDSDAERV